MTRNEIISQYNLIENTSKKYFNGSVWKSLSCGLFTIIGKTDRHNQKNSYIYCLCEFEDGGIVEADYTNISKGNVKSPNHRSVCGVAYIGQGKWHSKECGKTTKEYSTWLHMIRRCYSDKFHKTNPSYKSVTVCDRWLCFQNFCEDISGLENYEKWKSGKGYELDKDILCEQKGIYPKIYSPSTCLFVSKTENVSESTSRKNLTGLTYIGISPNGEEYEFENQTDFAQKHNLSSGLVSACLGKKRNSTKGWKFKVKGQSERVLKVKF